MQLPPALTSASHPLARQARSLVRGARERREARLFLVEGPRALDEALDAAAPVVWVLVSTEEGDAEREAARMRRALAAGIPVQPVRRRLLERLVPATTGHGPLAACRLPADADDPAALLSRAGADGLVVATWGIQDPGSVGTLVRSAAAFGAAALVALGGADPWSPKAVRASAGSIHRIAVARSAEATLPLEALPGRRLLAAVPRGGRPPESVDWDGPVVLLLGAETAGLPDDALAGAERVTIGMQPGVESLSVPVAGSILLEHARRGRARD